METANLATGLPLSLIAGIFLGTFVWPLKRIISWKWENTWLIYSLFALIILPWILAFLTVPDFISIYGKIPVSVLRSVFLFGAGWGIASVGFGIGVSMLGIALGTAIMLGLNNAIGAILPIILYTPEELITPAGLGISIGVGIMIIGIVFSAVAGNKKEKAKQSEVSENQPKGQFKKGLIICLIAGVFGAMFNFALVAGKPMEAIAIQNGATPLNAANPTWCISLFGGFLVTLAYCIFLFRKNKSAKLFVSGPQTTNWTYAGIMGFMWFGGVALYGFAVMNLGKLGASIGWPLIQSMAVLSGNLVGFFTGEWKGTGTKPVLYMFIGLAFLLTGIVIVGIVAGNS
jgi:L-rhamnose-H+ transport protein